MPEKPVALHIMDEPDYAVFTCLFKQACELCFRKPLTQPLTETEGKLFQNQVLEHTGLTVGWRSLKNYSFYVLNIIRDRQENPSIATMDTLARYVLKAPYTNEVNRKNTEGHHPYWFMYRDQQLAQKKLPPLSQSKKKWKIMASAALLASILLIIAYLIFNNKSSVKFTDNFTDLSDHGLQARDWQVLDLYPAFWNKRNVHKGELTLFTLPGDTWPDGANKPSIKNLLIRKLPEDCFTAELHLENFIPSGEWQQAGLLLLEDTSLNDPGMRVSLSYNDYFGGYRKPREILVQAISVPGHGGKPEEFAHYPVLMVDSAAQLPVLFQNLRHTAIRIERQRRNYRILYAGGSNANAAFKEVINQAFNFEPHYIAIFALKGNIKPTPVAPVRVSSFLLQGNRCE